MDALPVISIDPAPGKPSTVFDGSRFSSMRAQELRNFLTEIASYGSSTLVCWDAPLTGPTDLNRPGLKSGDFTKRPIEQFFSRAETTFKTPKGISVLGYGSCPHWTISRSLLGLPRVGPFDAEESCLPFRLLPEREQDGSKRARIVEIHPALAAWLWCREEFSPGSSWEYKNQNWNARNDRRPLWLDMWEIVLKKSGFEEDLPEPTSDDEFDAAIGYILGRAHEADQPTSKPRCAILGDQRNGAFLVPALPSLFNTWAEWKGKL